MASWDVGGVSSLSSVGVFRVRVGEAFSLVSVDGVLSSLLMTDSSFFVGSEMRFSVESRSKVMSGSFVGRIIKESILVIG